MNRTERILNHIAPFYRLWIGQRRRSAELVRRLDRAELELAVTRAHLALAVEQRQRARDVACAVEGEPFSSYDRAFLGWDGGA